MKIGNYEYELMDVSSILRIALRSGCAQKYRNTLWGHNFTNNMEKVTERIGDLPLNYKQTPKFTFLVIPAGKEFQDFTGEITTEGICNVPYSVDECSKSCLVIDENWFENFPETMDERLKVGITHEFAHMVHGEYFYQMVGIDEGFAEVFPHYLVSYDQQNQIHQQAIRNFSEKDFQTMDYLNQKGMFSLENPHQKNTQELKSYMSAYLWMLGYLKRVEKKLNKDKFAATNWILEKFAVVDEYKTKEEKYDAIAHFIGENAADVFRTTKLHKEGKNYLLNEYYQNSVMIRNQSVQNIDR